MEIVLWIKQASQQWNVKLIKCLLRNGYTQSWYDYSLFNKFMGQNQVHMLVYVDDLMITCSDITMINELKGILKLHFNLKHFGELR